jgi:hypothetical protein
VMDMHGPAYFVWRDVASTVSDCIMHQSRRVPQTGATKTLEYLTGRGRRASWYCRLQVSTWKCKYSNAGNTQPMNWSFYLMFVRLSWIALPGYKGGLSLYHIGKGVAHCRANAPCMPYTFLCVQGACAWPDKGSQRPGLSLHVSVLFLSYQRAIRNFFYF